MKAVYRIEQEVNVRRTYDYAAWYTDIKVPAGDYDVRFTTIDFKDCEPGDAYWALVILKGEVVDEYMAGHFGGVPIPGSPRHREGRIGEEETKHLQMYAREVNKALSEPSLPQLGPGRFTWIFE